MGSLVFRLSRHHARLWQRHTHLKIHGLRRLWGNSEGWLSFRAPVLWIGQCQPRKDGMYVEAQALNRKNLAKLEIMMEKKNRMYFKSSKQKVQNSGCAHWELVCAWVSTTMSFKKEGKSKSCWDVLVLAWPSKTRGSSSPSSTIRTRWCLLLTGVVVRICINTTNSPSRNLGGRRMVCVVFVVF